jgi:hypothetical protein
MYISDSISFPTQFALAPGLVVPAGGALVLWADAEAFQGNTHLGFQLSAGGEEIGLFDGDARGNVAIDTLSFGPQTTDISSGRCPDGYRDLVFMGSGSPGQVNLGSAACGSGELVDFSGTAQGGQIRIVLAGVLVTITTTAGQSVESVVAALADAIDANPVLAAAGIGASAVGGQLSTNGAVDSLEITDPGISSPGAGGPPPGGPQVPALGPAGTLLLLGLLVAFGRRAAARRP